MKAIRLRPRLLAALVLCILVVSPPARAEEGEAGFGPYPPLSAIYDDLQRLAAGRPELMRLEKIGESVNGLPIYAAQVGRRDGKTRPSALVTANLHAGEVISALVALGLVHRLLEGDGEDPWITALLDQTDFWIVVVANPDGYHRVISTRGKGGNLGARKNANGVDLNRNFPLAPGARSRHPLAGSQNPRSNYYMGTAPLSEPETRAIAELAAAHDFYAAINLHSVAGKFLYPHCYTRRPARHRDQFIRVGEAFVQKQGRWQYKVQNSYGWYPTLGDLDDFLYLEHGVLSFTVEHGTVGRNLPHALVNQPAGFWIMNPKDPAAWVENDVDAILAAIEAALDITAGRPYDPAACKPETK